MIRAVALAAALLLMNGCSCFRASAGFCVGLGASARVGVVDVGAGGGIGYAWGNVYGETGGHLVGEVGIPLIARAEGLKNDDEEVFRVRMEGLVPAGVRLLDDDPQQTQFFLNRETEVAVSAYLGFVVIHLGFEPAAIVRLFTGSKGREIPYVDPRTPPHTTPPVRPPIVRSPYRFVDPSEGAVQLDSLLDEPVTLVRVRTGRVEVAIAPHIALVSSGVIPGARVALEKKHAQRGGGLFATAMKRHDKDDLSRALADAPFAPEAPKAARSLGELRLESGDLDGAIESFELELALDTTDERGDATSRLGLVRRLRSTTQPALESSLEPPRLAGYTLVGQGRRLWALNGPRSVAWVSSSVLGPFEAFEHAIGSRGDLAYFLAVFAGSCERRVVAVDEHGDARWFAPLPGFNPWRFILAGDRIFAVSRNDAVAIDAASGRIEWYWHRHEREVPGEVPMDCRPIPKEELEGPAVRLTGAALEWRTDAFPIGYGEPDRLERVDPRTGLPLDDKK